MDDYRGLGIAWRIVAYTQLHRGSRVMVLGSLLTRSWEDRQSGQRRYRTVVRAAECLALSAIENDDSHEDVEDDESVMS
jgi:single-strand DNA-binding protein